MGDRLGIHGVVDILSLFYISCNSQIPQIKKNDPYLSHLAHNLKAVSSSLTRGKLFKTIVLAYNIRWWQKLQNVYSTTYSQAVTHPSTNVAQCCLTSVIGRELVFSTWYGRRQRVSGQFNLLRGLSSVQQKSTHILQTEMMGVTHLLWKWIKQLIAWSSKTG